MLYRTVYLSLILNRPLGFSRSFLRLLTLIPNSLLPYRPSLSIVMVILIIWLLAPSVNLDLLKFHKVTSWNPTLNNYFLRSTLASWDDWKPPITLLLHDIMHWIVMQLSSPCTLALAPRCRLSTWAPKSHSQDSLALSAPGTLELFFLQIKCPFWKSLGKKQKQPNWL